VSTILYFVFGLSIALANSGSDDQKWSAAFNADLCAQTPNSNTIKVSNFPGKRFPLKGTQDLFYYLTRPYDSNQKTVLFIDGGPGGIQAIRGQQLFDPPGVNVVHFHTRAAGCSAFPLSGRATRGIGFVSSAFDIESIRRDLGIESFDLIYGGSAGADDARVYARLFPAHVKLIVLDGVPSIVKDGKKKVVDPEFYRGDRIKIAGAVASLKSEWPEFSHEDMFLAHEQIMSDLDKLQTAKSTAYMQILYRAQWPDKVILNNRSNRYLFALHMVSYLEIADAKPYVGRLLLEFLPNSQSKVEFIKEMNSKIDERIIRQLLPAYDGDMSKLTGKEMLISTRVLVKKGRPPQALLCHQVPMIMLNGDQDNKTSAAWAYESFSNRECYTGTAAFIVLKGGHGQLDIKDPCWNEVFAMALRVSGEGLQPDKSQIKACDPRLVKFESRPPRKR
jgi:pimeloyl-ACP methyl ester carboxylesterase